MATYQITDPQSGKTVTVAGDTPPSQQDAENIFQQAGLRGNTGASSQTTTPPSGGSSNPLMDFLGNISKAGRVAGEGVMDLGRIGAYLVNKGTDAVSGQNTAQQHLINQPSTMMVSPQEANDVAANALNPNPLQNSVVKEAAGLASYLPMAPELGAFKGAGLMKAAVGGGIAGGLQGVSQDNATPQSVIGNAAVGGITGGALNGAGGVISDLAQKLGVPVGNALEKTGNRVISSQYDGVPIDNTTQADIAALGKYGISNINDVVNKTPMVTGAEGALNGVVGDIVNNGPQVKLNGITDQVDNVLKDLNFIPPAVEKKITDQIANFTDKIPVNGTNNATMAEPSATLQFMRGLEGKAAYYSSLARKSRDPGVQETAKAYQQIAGVIEDKLFNPIDEKGFQLTDDQLNQLHAIHPQLAIDAANQTNVAGLRSLQAPFVRLSQLAGQVQRKAGSSPISPVDAGIAAFTGGTSIPLQIALKLANTDTGKTVIGKGIAKGGQAVGNAGVDPHLQALIDYLGPRLATSH